MPSFR
jgi:hypothetical protein